MRPLFYIQHFWKEGNLIEPESDSPFTGYVSWPIFTNHIYTIEQKNQMSSFYLLLDALTRNELQIAQKVNIFLDSFGQIKHHMGRS